MLVVDASRSVAGAFCARLLHLRGDTVAAVGDLTTHRGALDPSSDRWLVAYLRADIDAVDDDGPAAAELCSRADVVLTGWDAGRPVPAARTWGDGAVEVNVSSFGTWGPSAGLRGSSLVDWAASGYLSITGLPDREPLPGPEHLPAYVAGYLAASAVEVGLRLRGRGDAVTRLEVATQEVLAGAHQTTFSNYAATGEVRGRHRHPQPLHPLDILECADGWVSVAIVTDAQFDAFAGLLGEPALLVDDRFATGWSRHAHADEFDDLVGGWFKARTADEIVELLQAQHVPAIAMADLDTIVDDPQLRARGFWQGWDGESGSGVMPGDPVRVVAGRSSAPHGQGAVAVGELPLTGTIVLDVTEFWSGPMASRLLADLGASVVRVERPGSRFHVHAAGPLVDWKMHRGKRSVAVDLKHPDGRGVVQDLVRRADVVVENLRPGTMARLGLGYDTCASLNPTLVYLSLSGFGQDGPRAGWASFGPLLEAASSMQARTSYPDGPPLLLGHSLPDAVGGFAGLFAVLHALRQRDATGAGSHLDVSQLEAYVAICGEEILRSSAGDTPCRVDIPRVLRCRGADAWVVLDALTAEEQLAVADRLGCGATPEAVAASVASRDKYEVAALVQASGVPAFPVLDAADLAAEPHLRARGHLVDLRLGPLRGWMPTIPVRGDVTVARPGAAAPAAGAHTVEVLRELLGYPAERIEELLTGGGLASASA